MTEILKGQSLPDIAIQETGTLESIVEIAVINNISITGDLKAGTDVLIPETITERQALNYYRRMNLRPASAIAARPAGIEYWAIEIDFTVS